MILSSAPLSVSTPWWLWTPSAVALLAYVVVSALPDSYVRGLQRVLVAAWLAHAFAIVVDVSGIGSPQAGARFGFAPALSATMWMVVSVYGIESRFVPMVWVRRTLCLAAAAVVVLAAIFPGEFRPSAASAWAPVHWVLGIASYGLFGAAVLHATMLNSVERRMRLKTTAAAGPMGLPLLRIERLTFRFVLAGFVLLTAAIVLGWWFLPGWRWDHKTVFSLLGWGVFAGLLAGRQAFGWRGRRATWWLYVGAGLLLLAYVGSRFVLEVVLHRPSLG